MSHFQGKKKLYRNRKKGIVGGVCAGVADYFELDVVLVRIIFIASLIFTLQVAFILYWVAYFILDNDPTTLTNPDGRLHFKMKSAHERKSVINSVHDRFGKIEDRVRKLEAYVTSTRFKLRDEIDRL